LDRLADEYDAWQPSAMRTRLLDIAAVDMVPRSDAAGPRRGAHVVAPGGSGRTF
jgi:hypothetical protein